MVFAHSAAPCRSASKIDPYWNAPLKGTGSRGGFDRLPSVLILELRGAQVAERGVEPSCVVDPVDEAGKMGGELLEGFVVHQVDGLDLQRLDEALGRLEHLT